MWSALKYKLRPGTGACQAGQMCRERTGGQTGRSSVSMQRCHPEKSPHGNDPSKHETRGRHERRFVVNKLMVVRKLVTATLEHQKK